MKVGILGCGVIAGTLAGTMKKMKNVELYGASSRSLSKAQKFCGEYGIQKAYGSYEELVQDPDVQLIYVATPHSHHFEHAKLCIEYNKPVLVEKAFTMTYEQAEELVAFARRKNVFLAEAIWTRYMPSRSLINELISSGIIGNVTACSASLWYPISHVKRMTDPSLAGGALLDLGVYTLNFALMHLGDDIERIDSSIRRWETGVDAMENLTIHYKNGNTATLSSGFFSRSDRKGLIYGEKGYIVVENINNPNSIKAFNLNDELIAEKEVPAQITGYEYEVDECIRLVEQGKTESESMPLDRTLQVMKIMDGLLDSWGMKKN